ncbi:hypothetical protein F2P81_021667 [Scophthalmus maximus]|uniref:Beta/gamma crystallin 'Greek key' domain-containing protein n=1 Tax=Scophthalmus maximus TaxID=52904 RepID=A0A6A4S5X5_SCOMX|nr:hypothetical protein F2P81_021667 [Scophthalmus maximus]
MRLYERIEFGGQMMDLVEDCPSVIDRFHVNNIFSCNVTDGNWLFYEHPHYRGRMYLIRPGNYKRFKRNIGVTCGCESQLALRCDLLDSSWSLYRDRAKKERAREKSSLLRLSINVVRKTAIGPYKLKLFDRPNFDGQSLELTDNMKTVQEKWLRQEVQSCKVLAGSWVFFEHPNFCGRQYLLEKGEYRHHSEWGALKGNVGSIRRITEKGNPTSQS